MLVAHSQVGMMPPATLAELPDAIGDVFVGLTTLTVVDDQQRHRVRPRGIRILWPCCTSIRHLLRGAEQRIKSPVGCETRAVIWADVKKHVMATMAMFPCTIEKNRFGQQPHSSRWSMAWYVPSVTFRSKLPSYTVSFAASYPLSMMKMNTFKMITMNAMQNVYKSAVDGGHVLRQRTLM